ncbi:MAG: hypothetical protein K1X81_11655 [Bacteroidia bacterium]|nr:hypothetical protein [Bacteroidia bacterium]
MHFEHREWLVRLNFFKSELEIFEKMLGEVAVKNNATDIRSKIEHFQNQFLLQRHRLLEVKRDVNKSESAIANQLMDNMAAWDRQTVKQEGDLRSAINTFDYLFTELKKEFKLFLEKVY